MPILSGDIKLVASQVMDDVTEGGGSPTATVIADGVSNAIFPDISELDRAGGRVNLRKLFVSVQTGDTDTYMGSNMIVAAPPADPNVSITLFTGSTFDRRDAAKSRVESYLTKGPVWGGCLLENHVAGQRAIQILQSLSAELPTIGKTLVLVQDEGTMSEKAQYVRTTSVTSVVREYPNAQGTMVKMSVVTCGISDALRLDLKGSPGTALATTAVGSSLVRDTTVADAGTYAGVVPLTDAADLGAFTVNAASVFTQLVPSAQTETPISDVRTNGLGSALVATGAPVTQTINTTFTTAQNLFVGGPILPGSLSISRSTITLTDKGGLLITSGSAEVGQVDYDSGILSLSSNVWGTSGGAHQLTFTPAAAPDLISDQRAIRVTAESRSQSYAFTMTDPPLPRTMSASYLAQGQWYVLRDDGSGKLSGTSSAYGVGTVNYTTGSVVLSLGALPDIGSSVLVQSASAVTSVAASNTLLTNSGRLYTPINTDGAVSEEKGSKTIEPSSLSVTWNDGTACTATDNGAGVVTGDASGVVDYANGVVRLSPNALPPSGTVFSVSRGVTALSTAVGVTLAGGSLGATGITPGSVAFTTDLAFSYTTVEAYRLTFRTRAVSVVVRDDAAGNLRFSDNGGTVTCGTVNYSTGAIAFSLASVGNADIAGPTWSHNTAFGDYSESWSRVVLNRSGVRSATSPAAANVSFSVGASAANTATVAVSQYFARTVMVPGYTLKGVGFTLGASRYQQLTDGTLLKDVSPTTGGGTPAGSVSAATGVVTVLSWSAGASPTLADWRGLIAPPSVGVAAPFSAFSTVFRTATSPLRPGSVSVLGTLQDGTTFNVTAGVDGKINGTRVKGRVDYQYGLVELYFVNPAGDSGLNVDLGFLQIAGLTTTPADLAMLNSLRYNAVAFSYLPLDANILGIDPVRLPSNGQVPIFRTGGFAVVGHTGAITATVSNAQVINCARVRLSRVRVIGHDGAVINTGYTPDLEAGTVTFTNVTGYSQPVTVEHRVEDMAVVKDVQISGEITFTRPLTHDYPVGSFVSSALVAGDLKSRVSALFDQATWTSVWADSLIGASATGTFNDVLAPVVVTNAGALTERWALIFTSTTAFNVVGEHVGVIGTGNINAECAPINPSTAAPYFSVPALGWGIGWGIGNVLRFNTVGAMAPVWAVRTIQQGPATGTEHSFTLLSRGDVDRA